MVLSTYCTVFTLYFPTVIPWILLKGSYNNNSMYMLNSNGDRLHPCITHLPTYTPVFFSFYSYLNFLFKLSLLVTFLCCNLCDMDILSFIIPLILKVLQTSIFTCHNLQLFFYILYRLIHYNIEIRVKKQS